MTKLLLDKYEALTDARLNELSKSWGVRVFAKVRLADVLPVERSGIDSNLYRFALQSHFDFVVADENHRPKLAIEFDGQSHFTEKQLARDRKKERLCEVFDMPWLRINSRYLERIYRGMDLLGWFVHWHFGYEMLLEAQQAGEIPWDDPIDPLFLHSIEGERRSFPLWISHVNQAKLYRLLSEGRIFDPGISTAVVSDSDGNTYAFGSIRISSSEGVAAKTAMRSQGMRADAASVLEQIVCHEVYCELMDVLAARKHPIECDTIHAMRESLTSGRSMLRSSTWSHGKG